MRRPRRSVSDRRSSGLLLSTIQLGFTVLIGLGAGLAGVLVTLCLHAVQHLAYGYSEGTFLDGLRTAPPVTRVVALVVAGLLGGAGWYALRRWGAAVVSVEQAVAGRAMPPLVTALNAVLQVVIVGLGASIGREAAPRELGALVADQVTRRAGLDARQTRILMACGAGAGLAAVYGVPLGGAMFVVEILLVEVSTETVVPAFISSAVATVVGRLVVPSMPLYQLPAFGLTGSLLAWSVIAGPLLGLAAMGFARVARLAQEHRPTGWRILPVMPVVFAGIGLLSLALPEILGNGRALGQLAFDTTMPLGLLVWLLVGKIVATWATMGAGAAGGTLTPSLAIGAALGALGGTGWSLIWPACPPAACALIGAAAFLAGTLRAPLTALLLVVEFTHQGPAMIVPLMLAVAGSMGVQRLLGRRLTDPA